MNRRLFYGGAGGGRGGRSGGFSSPMIAHDLGGAFHNADSITNVNLKLSDGDMISTKANEVNAFAAKAIPADDDLLMIEDSAAVFAKKKITMESLRPYNYRQNVFASDCEECTLYNYYYMYCTINNGIWEVLKLHKIGDPVGGFLILIPFPNDFWIKTAFNLQIHFFVTNNPADGTHDVIQWGITAWHVQRGQLINFSLAPFDYSYNFELPAVAINKMHQTTKYTNLAFNNPSGQPFDNDGQLLIKIARRSDQAGDTFGYDVYVHNVAVEFFIPGYTP